MEIFTSIQTSIGKIDIIQGKLFHLFNAQRNSDGTPIDLVQKLALQLCYINGNQITHEQFNNLEIYEGTQLCDILNCMVTPVEKF